MGFGSSPIKIPGCEKLGKVIYKSQPFLLPLKKKKTSIMAMEIMFLLVVLQKSSVQELVNGFLLTPESPTNILIPKVV